MEIERKKRLKKRHLFLISLILHILVLILLFFFFKHTIKDVFFKKQQKPAKVVFQKPKPKPRPKPKSKPKPKPKPKPKLPAFQGLKKPRSQQKPKSKPKPEDKKIEQKKPCTKQEKKEIPKPKQKKLLVKKTEEKTSLIKKAQKETPQKKQELPKPSKKKEKEKKVKADEKTKKLTLKDVSKGFLDYAQKQGANLIQYTKSVEGAPTEEQLKHERYIKKIFDCIETSLKIHKNSLVIMRPMAPNNTLIVLINIVLDNNGKINHISIAKTSGIFEFDNFMLSIINESSTSFPPVPSYLSTDKYYLPIKFFIPAGMVMARREV